MAVAGQNTRHPPARPENYCESKQTYFSYSLDKAFHLPEFQAKLFFTRNWVGGFYWDSFLKGQGPVSWNARKGPRAYFKTKTCWIVAQFLAHKPVNFASLTDSFIVSFANYWNLNAITANINQLSGLEKFPGISRNGAQAPVTYTFFASGGCPLTTVSTVVPCNV